MNFSFFVLQGKKEKKMEELIPIVITPRGCRFQLDKELYPKDVNKNNLNVSNYRVLACDNIGWVPVNHIECLFPIAPGWTPIATPEARHHALEQLKQDRAQKLDNYCALQQQKTLQRKVTEYWPQQDHNWYKTQDERDLETALKLSLHDTKQPEVEEKADEIYRYDANNNNYTLTNSKKRPSNRIEDSEEDQQIKKAIELSLAEEKRHEFDNKMRTMVENGTNWSREAWQAEVFDFYDKRANELAGIYGEAKRHWEGAQQEINFNNNNRKQKQD